MLKEGMLGFLGREIHQSWLVVFLCIGILVGTVLGLIFRINFFGASGWILVISLGLIVIYFEPKMIFIGVVLMLGMILAFFRTALELNGEDYIRQFYGKTILVTGIINGDPETDEKETKFKLVDLEFGEEKVRNRGNFYVSEYKNEKLARGDKIVLSGKLTEGFGTYVGYMYKPKIIAWERPEPGDLVLKIRNWFAAKILRLVPEPQANLGLSYLLGMKAGLPEDLDENLRMVGLVHIVVASGAHLSILVEIARKIFGRLSRFSGLLFSLLFVIFFMAMVGWTPSILRAGVMSILTLLAWYVGRKFAAWRIILIVAAFTLLLSPMFIFNLGWLLSFASFSGIMILGPRWTRFFYGEKKPGFIAETVITTIAATMMTLPIVLYFYGTMSLVSVIANLLILPTLPYAMGLVFLTGVFARIPGIEMVISFLATKLLDFHIMVVNFFGGMKSFMVKIEPNQILVFLIYIIVLAPLLIGLIRRKMLKSREVRY